MKKWIPPILVALVAAAAAFGLCRWKANCIVSPAGADPLGDARRLTRALSLTDAQAAQVAGLDTAYNQSLESCCSNHCEARMKLGGMLFEPGTSEAKLREEVELMCKAQAESDLATLRHIKQVHALLTPDQQKRYEELVTGCVCGACPNHFDHNHLAAK